MKLDSKIYTIIFLLLTISCVQAEIIDGWQIKPYDASDPLLFKYQGVTLHVLRGAGPVFALSEDKVGPEDYQAKVISTYKEDDYIVLECRAADEEFSAEYILKFKKLADRGMEMLVEGPCNVSCFQCGNIIGADDVFKQFYTGERDMESFPGIVNDNFPPMIYWPSGDLYVNTFWDADWSHAKGYSHRLSPKKNFAAKNPPVSCDVEYALLSDGSRPTLKERFVFRFSSNLWEAYGPVINEPSRWRNELAEMVFFDGWTDFAHGSFALDWLKKITDGRMKFYSIIQTWGCEKHWDESNPDAYRIPDHDVPGRQYGTKEQLKDYIALGKSMGRVGLRCNYMHIGTNSWSINEGLVKKAINSSGEPAWHTNFHTAKALVERQEKDIRKDFSPTTTFHDQWGSTGSGWPVVNFDAEAPGAGTISATRQIIREICTMTQNIHNSPLSSETLNGEFLIGAYTDTGDYGIMGADHRYDFTPEYKLRRLHQLTMTHSMGMGYRFFVGPWEKGWTQAGYPPYFESDERLDAYRSCEVLYGNGAYLFFAGGKMRKVHAMTECFTVGIAQRYYALEPIDYVEYSKGGRWRVLDKIIPKVDDLGKLQEWFKQFHIRYANGCHVWVNRDEKNLDVSILERRTICLPKNGWLVYTEDGSLIAYTALVNDPIVAGHEGRVDFCEDKQRKIKYANPRKLSKFCDVTLPTVWFDGSVHYELNDPDTTFEQALKNKELGN